MAGTSDPAPMNAILQLWGQFQSFKVTHPVKSDLFEVSTGSE